MPSPDPPITADELAKALARCGTMRVLVQVAPDEFLPIDVPMVRQTGRLDSFLVIRPADAPPDWF